MHAAALAPKEASAPSVVSLFAGGGGSSLGYMAAGFRELLAVDRNEDARWCLTANLRANASGMDLYAATGADVLAEAGVAAGALDVLDGSPPCQGFSKSGVQRTDDVRSSLVSKFITIALAVAPRVVVMENVMGMTIPKLAVHLSTALGALRRGGYRAEARVVDFSRLGIPQRRRRVILVATREDVATAAWPSPLRCRPLTVLEAMHALNVDLPREERPLLRALWHGTSVGTDYAKAEMKRRKAGGHVIVQPAFFSWFKPDPSKPSRTVTTAHIYRGDGAPIFHWSEPRCLGVEECARLQSFPDEYIFPANGKVRYLIIGNAVPPLGMMAIASAIKSVL